MCPQHIAAAHERTECRRGRSIAPRVDARQARQAGAPPSREPQVGRRAPGRRAPREKQSLPGPDIAPLGRSSCCLPFCLSQSARGKPRAGSRPAKFGERPLNLAPPSTVEPRRCTLSVHRSVMLLSQPSTPSAPPQRPFWPTSPPRTPTHQLFTSHSPSSLTPHPTAAPRESPPRGIRSPHTPRLRENSQCGATPPPGNLAAPPAHSAQNRSTRIFAVNPEGWTRGWGRVARAGGAGESLCGARRGVVGGRRGKRPGVAGQRGDGMHVSAGVGGQAAAAGLPCLSQRENLYWTYDVVP